jgi:hypothetical protein
VFCTRNYTHLRWFYACTFFHSRQLTTFEQNTKSMRPFFRIKLSKVY